MAGAQTLCPCTGEVDLPEATVATAVTSDACVDPVASSLAEDDPEDTEPSSDDEVGLEADWTDRRFAGTDNELTIAAEREAPVRPRRRDSIQDRIWDPAFHLEWDEVEDEGGEEERCRPWLIATIDN